MVCASAGNLGQALAYSGSRRGLDVTVVAARTANPLKLRQIAAFGADVRLEARTSKTPGVLAREIAQAMAPTWSRTAWTWRPARAPPRSGSSSSETIRGSTSCSSPSAAVRWPAAWLRAALARAAREVIGIQPLGAPAMALRGDGERSSRATASRRSPTASPGAVRSPRCSTTCWSCSTTWCSCARTRSRPPCARSTSMRSRRRAVRRTRDRRRPRAARAVRGAAGHHDPVRKQRGPGRLRALGAGAGGGRAQPDVASRSGAKPGRGREPSALA